tara:strand:+ start:905 stop:1279 length:375 start_codon:yes stop_codon:yes gene_type:complete
MIITWTYTATENKDVVVNTEDPDTEASITTHQVTHKYEPISAALSTKSFCAYKDHPWLLNIKAKNLQKFNKEWLIELGFDPAQWKVLDDGTVEEIGKVKTQQAVDNWLKPNEVAVLSPVEVDEI